MKSTFKVLTLALSVALPLGTALADSMGTDAPALGQSGRDYGEQARGGAADFRDNGGVASGAAGGQMSEPVHEQVRTRQQRAGEYRAATETAGEHRMTGVDRALRMMSPAAAERPAMMGSGAMRGGRGTMGGAGMMGRPGGMQHSRMH